MLFDPFQEVDQNAWRDQNIISFFQTYTCQISAYRPTELTHRVKLVFLFRHKKICHYNIIIMILLLVDF